MKRTITIIFVALCVFSLAWHLVIPGLFKSLVGYSASYIAKKYEYLIKPEDLRLKPGFLPYFNITANKIEVLNPKELSIITLDDVKLKVSILPLIFGEIQIDNFSLNSIKWNLYLDEPILQNSFVVTQFKNICYNAKRVTLNKYNLAIAPKQNSESIKLTGENLEFSNLNRIRHFKSSSEIVTENNTAQIITDLYIPQKLTLAHPLSHISIKNLDINPLFAPFKALVSEELVSGNGTINLILENRKFDGEFKNIRLNFKEQFKSIILPPNLHCSGEFRISENEVSVLGLQIQGENLDLKSNIKIKKPFSKLTELNIESGVQNTRTETLIKLLPPIKAPNINLLELKRTPLFGDINGEISIIGKKSNPQIMGNVLINNTYLTFKDHSKKNCVKLLFKGDKLDYDVFVTSNGDEYVTVQGSEELYGNKLAKILIKSSPAVNLAVAKNIVDPLSKIFDFKTGPLPIMKLDGIGNIDMQIEGNRANPHIWGKLTAQKATASLIDLKGIEIKNTDADINFKNQDITFNLINATIDGLPVKISGICNVFGNMNTDITIKGFSAAKSLYIIKNSPILKDVLDIMPPIETLGGKLDLDLKLTGDIQDINDVKLGKNLFSKGEIKFLDVSAGVSDFEISHINGNGYFDGLDVKLDAASLINNSKISINGEVKKNIANLNIKSNNLNLKDLLHNSALKGLADDNYIRFDCNYNGKADIIEFDKLKLDARISQSAQNSPISFTSGDVNIKNGVCNINNVKGFITQNPFNMNAKVNNIGQKNQNINANLVLKNASLSTINVIREFYLIPTETKELLRRFEFLTGKTDINLKVVNNKPFTNFELDNVSINYAPLELPVKIINGQVTLKNNQVYLNKINTLADNMPIFIDGEIHNIYKNPYYNIYLNSVPKQSFIDKYLNKNSLYPLKIKGDIIYSAKIKGVTDLYNIAANAKIGERSSVYYLGATVGDNENPTIMDFDGDIVKNNSIKINNFEYNKSVLSQNNRSTLINFLKIKGLVKLVNNEPEFHNLLVKTDNATDARIFNVIFKKPNIKQGLFTSDLKINGKLSDLKILGEFNIFDINAPILQAILKDVSLKFTPNLINIASKGEIFSNEITFKAEALNSLKYPFYIKNGHIHFNKLDLNAAIDDFNKLDIKKPKSVAMNQPIDLTTLIIERIDLTANDVLIKGIAAKNLKTLITLSEKMLLKLSDYSVDLAKGHLGGDFVYNLLSNRIDLLINAESIDANELSTMLFDLPNQMYGDLTGTANLSCNGTNDKICTSTLNGNAIFKVANGRMPKLGSLEYLLKAGNLLKGGITGVSINGLIDLITPLKTGEFSNIYGEIHLSDGIADNINISSEGKDLNLYIKGRYNLAISDAEMYVFGLLSKNIKTPLGKVGNMSLNTLLNLIPGVDLETQCPFIHDLNKIPGIELSQRAYRKFIAEIRGDIKGDNYVKSFKWIN